MFFLRIFSTSFKICFGIVVTNDWKTILDIAIVLKVMIFSSSLSFLIFHIFNTHLQRYKNFSPLQFFIVREMST